MNLERIQQKRDAGDKAGPTLGRGDELDVAIVQRRLQESGLDYAGELDYLVVAARRITRSDGAAIAIAEDDETSIRCKAWHGIAPPLGTVIQPGSGISGLCLSSGQPVLCTNTETDKRVDAIACQAMNVRSIAIVPVFRERAVVGLIEVFSSQTAAFDGASLSILRELASLVAGVSARAKEKLRQPERNVFQMSSRSETTTSASLGPAASDSQLLFAAVQAKKEPSSTKLIASAVAVIVLGAFGLLWLYEHHAPDTAAGVVAAASPAPASPEPGLPPPVDSSGKAVKPLPINSGESAPTFQPPSNAPLETIRPAKLIYKVKPSYPAAAAQAGMTGRVSLQAKISKDGRVLEVHVLTGAPILADAAVAAVKQWRYRPTQVDGRTIESSTNISIDFPEPD